MYIRNPLQPWSYVDRILPIDELLRVVKMWTAELTVCCRNEVVYVSGQSPLFLDFFFKKKNWDPSYS